MKVISINIAEPQSFSYQGETVSTGIFKQPIDGSAQISATGISGDHIVDTTVHGGLDQAIYLYSLEDYQWWSKQLGRELEPGAFGENITLSAFPAEPWVIGDRLQINDVLLEISAPRTPCFKLASKMNDPTFGKKFVDAVKPGAYARVINPGTIAVGQSATVTRTGADYATVNEVFVEWHKVKRSKALLEKALNSPLAAVHKATLQMWYKESQ